MTYESQHWHADPRCFACSGCSLALVGRPFLPRDGKIFCSVACSIPADARAGRGEEAEVWKTGTGKEGRGEGERRFKGVT